MKILLGESSETLSELKIVDLTIFSFLSDFYFILFYFSNLELEVNVTSHMTITNYHKSVT